MPYKDSEKAKERNSAYYVKNKDSLNARQRKARAENPEKFRKHDRQYHRKNKDRINARCRKHRAQNGDKYRKADRTRYTKNKASRIDIVKRRYQKLRAQFLEIYGTECACCHEKEEGFLTIGHIKNDGKKDRNTYGTGTILKMAVDSPDFTRYKTLCFNCNLGANVNGGVCPHKSPLGRCSS